MFQVENFCPVSRRCKLEYKLVCNPISEPKDLSMSENVNSALRILLSEIVDYAGLFPPSGVAMDVAVQNYADYLQSEHAWMLGRFIVPITRLGEFAEQAKPFWARKEAKLWHVSVLAGEELYETIWDIQNFNQTYAGKAVVDTLELKAVTAAEITATKEILASSVTTYFEIPLSSALPEQISVLATMRARAKIRTGGVVQDAFPPIDEMIKFLRVCIAANVPFKATAGLHHPLRSVRRLTYEPDSPTGTMHGFLNLFLSAAFLRQNLKNTFVHKLMADKDPANFKFDDDGANWNENRVDLQTLRLIRERNSISFGSCSFVEPIEDLQKLGFL